MSLKSKIKQDSSELKQKFETDALSDRLTFKTVATEKFFLLNWTMTQN
ncbi:hypothetical protein [Nostoc sp. KVJ20]|nr:hypothetical protein [Nostoc sp. KVJ20]